MTISDNKAAQPVFEVLTAYTLFKYSNADFL